MRVGNRIGKNNIGKNASGTFNKFGSVVDRMCLKIGSKMFRSLRVKARLLVRVANSKLTFAVHVAFMFMHLHVHVAFMFMHLHVHVAFMFMHLHVHVAFMFMHLLCMWPLCSCICCACGLYVQA